MQVGNANLLQLAGFGYVFPVVNWDDSAFVKVYGTLPNSGLADPAALCFVVPAAGRYRVGLFAFPLAAALGNMAIGLSLDSLNAAWANAPTSFLAGVANPVNQAAEIVMEVPGAVGDIWIPFTQIGAPGEGLAPGSYASIIQIG
jgi:hypothetical protein